MACYTGILQQMPLKASVSLVQLTGEVRKKESLQGTVRISSYMTGTLSERNLYGRMTHTRSLSGVLNKKPLSGTLRDITRHKLKGTLSLSSRLHGNFVSPLIKGTLGQHSVSGALTQHGAIVGAMRQRELFPWVSVVCPIDLVASCFGGGFWIENYPWIESDAYLENP